MTFFRTFFRLGYTRAGLYGLAAFLMMGCGAEEYEKRLLESKNYYAYLDRIENNLAPKWTDGRAVESVRVPKQFAQIPAPVPTKNEKGEDEWPAVDPRQPDYVNLIFPPEQLIGAWEREFEVEVAGRTDKRKGYIYVLSNYWMFLAEDPAKALQFVGSTVNLIGNALDDHIPPAKLESPDIEQHPKPGRYLPPAQYSVFNFQPKPITSSGAEGNSTVDYRFALYARQNGDIQAIIVLAIPDNVSSQEKLPERVPMMLENFQISRTPPRSAPTGGGGAANSSSPF